jgi:hypothetical protein
MPRSFFGNMLIALQTSISTTTLSSTANATTSSVTASVSGGRGTYTYLWVSSGIGCTIINPNAATTTFIGASVIGKTSVYCSVTDTTTGNTLNTPLCNITWTAIPITSMTFTLDGVPFINDETRSVGTNHIIEINSLSVTPLGATYSPISLGRSTQGTSSLTSFGRGNYQGSFTSPILTLV